MDKHLFIDSMLIELIVILVVIGTYVLLELIVILVVIGTYVLYVLVAAFIKTVRDRFKKKEVLDVTDYRKDEFLMLRHRRPAKKEKETNK